RFADHTSTLRDGIETSETDEFRIRMVRQGELRGELERADRNVKWGKFLRAPDIFFDIQEKVTPLANCAIVEFGGKSGINEFYYVDDETVRKHKIEKEFLQPLLKS